MGLDMYLTAKRYLWNKVDEDISKKVNEIIGVDGDTRQRDLLVGPDVGLVGPRPRGGAGDVRVAVGEHDDLSRRTLRRTRPKLPEPLERSGLGVAGEEHVSGATDRAVEI